jgi:hypothetical protein
MFLLTQVFQAAALENVCKLLCHKDQTCLTIDDAFQTFFMDQGVESDKKQSMINVVNAVDNEQDNLSPEQDVATFRPQQQQRSQQRYQQQGSYF